MDTDIGQWSKEAEEQGAGGRGKTETELVLCPSTSGQRKTGFQILVPQPLSQRERLGGASF